MDNLYTEKQKMEKEKSKKGKAKSRAKLRYDGDTVSRRKMQIIPQKTLHHSFKFHHLVFVLGSNRRLRIMGTRNTMTTMISCNIKSNWGILTCYLHELQCKTN